MKRTKHNGGFTMTELMIVAIVIGILTAIMLANSGLVLGNYQVKSVVRDVVSMIRLGRTRAASTHSIYRMTFCTTSRSCVAARRNVTTGGIALQQGASSYLATAFPETNVNTNMWGLELKVYEPKSSSRNVWIERVYVNGLGWRSVENIYIMPDGRMTYCRVNGALWNCENTEIYVCVRSSVNDGDFSAGRTFREVHVKWNGTIAVNVGTRAKRCR